jgi:hypothetical protein
MSLPLIHGLHEERHQDASVLTPDPVIIPFGTIQTPDFLDSPRGFLGGSDLQNGAGSTIPLTRR